MIAMFWDAFRPHTILHTRLRAAAAVSKKGHREPVVASYHGKRIVFGAQFAWSGIHLLRPCFYQCQAIAMLLNLNLIVAVVVQRSSPTASPFPSPLLMLLLLQWRRRWSWSQSWWLRSSMLFLLGLLSIIGYRGFLATQAF